MRKDVIKKAIYELIFFQATALVLFYINTKLHNPRITVLYAVIAFLSLFIITLSLYEKLNDKRQTSRSLVYFHRIPSLAVLIFFLPIWLYITEGYKGISSFFTTSLVLISIIIITMTIGDVYPIWKNYKIIFYIELSTYIFWTILLIIFTHFGVNIF